MLLMNVCTPVKIGDGAGYLEDAGIGSGGETKSVSDQYFLMKRGVIWALQWILVLL
jgi:hypothetical protein